MKNKYLAIAIFAILCAIPFRLLAATVPKTQTQILQLAEVEDREDANERENVPTNRVVPAPVITNSASTPTETNQATVPAATDNAAAQDPATSNTPTNQPTPTSLGSTSVSAQGEVAPIISTAFPWPWMITRTTGISSFILLALMTIIGTSITTGLLFRFMSPASAWSLHRAIGSTLLISVVIHVVSLLFDHFINLHLKDVFIPFASSYQPLYVALGTIGFYLLLLILITSLYTMAKYARFWRIVHYLGFVMFVSIFIHGVKVGTDTHQWWMQVIYWGAGIGVGLISIYRVVWKIKKPAQ